MKTKILLAALGCLLLTGCWTSGDDYRATSSGRIVLRYTEQTLTCFTDLLRFTIWGIYPARYARKARFGERTIL